MIVPQHRLRKDSCSCLEIIYDTCYLIPSNYLGNILAIYACSFVDDSLICATYDRKYLTKVGISSHITKAMIQKMLCE